MRFEKGLTMSKFKTLEEVFDCYGRGNLVAVGNIKQIIHYTTHGCQPEFLYESEVDKGRITAWFHKEKTKDVYKTWMNNRPTK